MIPWHRSHGRTGCPRVPHWSRGCCSCRVALHLCTGALRLLESLDQHDSFNTTKKRCGRLGASTATTATTTHPQDIPKISRYPDIPKTSFQEFHLKCLQGIVINTTLQRMQLQEVAGGCRRQGCTMLYHIFKQLGTTPLAELDPAFQKQVPRVPSKTTSASTGMFHKLLAWGLKMPGMCGGNRDLNMFKNCYSKTSHVVSNPPIVCPKIRVPPNHLAMSHPFPFQWQSPNLWDKARKTAKLCRNSRHLSRGQEWFSTESKIIHGGVPVNAALRRYTGTLSPTSVSWNVRSWDIWDIWDIWDRTSGMRMWRLDVGRYAWNIYR